MHEITKYGDRRGTTFFRTNLRPISPASCTGLCGRKMMNKPDEKTRVASSRCYRLEKRNRGKGMDEEKK